MNESDFCCIKQVTKSISITIPIKYITNEIAAVSEILEGWKRQYVPKLQGVLVNYRNIRLSARTVVVHPSRTSPKCIITATFDLFCPTVGEIVKGTINRISREHIGCLIEGTINVSIHRQRHPPPELSKFIKINHPILFEIENFFYDRQTIRVKGHISHECVELMKEVFPSALVNGFVGKDDSALSEELFSNTESAAEEAFSNLDNFVELTNDSQSKVGKTLNSVVESPRGKSKKRKQESESPNLDQIKKKPKLCDPNLSGSSSDDSTVNDLLNVNEFSEKSNEKTLKRKRESETLPIFQHSSNKKPKLSDSISDSSEDASDHEEKDSLSNSLTMPDKKQSSQGTVDEGIKKSISNSSDSSSSEDSIDHKDDAVLNNLVTIKQESPTKKKSKKLKSKKGKRKSSDKKESKNKKKSKKKDKLKSKKKSKVSATGEVLKKDKKKSKKDKKVKKKDKTKNSKSKSLKIKSELD